MIDDVGTIESSDDEEVIVESVNVIATNESTNINDKIKQGTSKPLIGEEWMIDDVGTMESSDDEEIIQSTKVDSTKQEDNPVLKMEIKKETPVKPVIGEEWMIDDVGTIESSDDEDIVEESKRVDSKQQEPVPVHTVEQNTVKPIIGEEWMIDDVGTMSSSDEEEVIVESIKVIEANIPVDDNTSKPVIGEKWMIDDVGTMESSDEEEVEALKPLALPMPKYSDIAGKEKN
jgi:hypothetical protein